MGESNYCRIAIESGLILPVHLLVSCEIERGQWVVGPQPSCPQKVRQGFLYPALGNQRGSQVVFSGEVCFGDFQSVRPEGDIVAPETHLPMKRKS